MIKLSKYFLTLATMAFSISTFAAPTRIPYLNVHITGMGPALPGSVNQTILTSRNYAVKIQIYGSGDHKLRPQDFIIAGSPDTPLQGYFRINVCDNSKAPSCAYNQPMALLFYTATEPTALGFTYLNVDSLVPNKPGQPQVSWNSSTDTLSINGNGWVR